ncbi:sugar phosphate isomerase/epimerase family protein [Rhodococcus sp. WAY2]|uniref:sugar phosphate isomerase/epimerase family protein n=1 Tax=Rhodococcus sp. WAY2 TaxID=2663121 RepID=UPI001320455E|nr:sugar phosphate isomerase/epimerase [Rhodococcus sp. WAY2]QHE73297.1 Sugar phosphate isomerase/epimerase [Rhodococcus sp. WAY2]
MHSALDGKDLIASYYTLSGSPTRAISRHPFVERVQAASGAGYAGMGLTMYDVDAVLQSGLTLGSMRRTADDHGITVAELETLAFSPTPTTEELDAARRMVEVGHVLDARHMNVIVGLPGGTPIERDEVATGFAQICDIAAEAGMLVGIEFMPFRAVATLQDAMSVIDMAGRLNGGLVVDSYHFFRGGTCFEDLAAVPAERIITLQVTDLPWDPPADLLVETQTGRLLPGEGELPLLDWIRTVDATGANAPVGVEILSDTLRELSVDEVARATYESTRRLLETARAS